MRWSATEGKLLLIGFGNELRGDDGAGCRVVRRLEGCLRRRLGRLAMVLVVPQLLPELAEPIGRARLVIFVDASCLLSPGQVQRKVLRAAAAAGSSMAHHLSAQGLLGMARALYGRAPSAWLYAIGGGSFGYQTELSAPARRAVGHVVRDIAARTRQACPAPRRSRASALPPVRRFAHGGCAKRRL
jgi:hydrogenase maturation protease